MLARESSALLGEMAAPLAGSLSWWRYLASADPAVLRVMLQRPVVTPIAQVRVEAVGGVVELYLKLESYNITGSSKDRTARGLVDELLGQRRLLPGCEVVESTSGNLGVALALAARAHGFTFRAVVDPTLSPRIGALMRMLGARLDVVSGADAAGGHLVARIERVERLCADDPARVWPNQYESVANVDAHYRGTGAELFDQLPSTVELVAAPVSTGGTLAGVGRRARERDLDVVAADSVGSVALGGTPGCRLLTGIGSARRSRLLTDDDVDDCILVPDAVAVSVCRLLSDRLGVALGGSSGAVVAACVIAAIERGATVGACICPDGGDRYGHSIYDDAWCLGHGLGASSPAPLVDVSFEGWIGEPWAGPGAAVDG
jgi:N-(2-amino-2-carboxyethyl)-L-glutamate synthase